MITQTQLENDLRCLGLSEGDIVHVHSSLRNIGRTPDGPDTVINAILSVLGKSGTLAVPAHSMNYPGCVDEPFDRKNSPGFQLGIIAETVRKRAGAARSGHPTHSTAALGYKAHYLTDTHCLHDPFDKDSPMYRMYESNAKVLLLGVNHNRNSAIHLADSILNTAYNHITYNENWANYALMYTDDNRIVKVPQTNFPGHSGAFLLLEGLFYYNKLVKYGMVGNAVSMIMYIKDIVDFTIDILKNDPEFLLCHDRACPCCNRRREYLRGIA